MRFGYDGFWAPCRYWSKDRERPDEHVIDIAGDGSIQMVVQEFAKAFINKIPIKIMILNNGHLGKVRQLQDSIYNGRYSHTDVDNSVDFVKLIEAYGGIGFRVKKRMK